MFQNLLCAGLLFSLLNISARAESANAQQAGSVLTIEGTVEVTKANGSQWIAATTNTVVDFGGSLRTGPHSRATVRLSDLSVIRVNEKTVLEIRAQADGSGSQLGLQAGSTYFFNRSKPSSVQFHTPLISGAIRGTEFNLAAEDNGRTTVSLIDGEVALNNAKGELVLVSGEQGIVDPGQAPRKTAMLNAINIIQWSLYYPAVIDPDELGLTAGQSSGLADSLAAYRSGDLLAALDKVPANFVSGSEAEKVQHAALLLSVGQVDQTEAELKTLNSSSPYVSALRKLIAAVKHQEVAGAPTPQTASEFLAESYYLQSRSQLMAALQAAQSAAKKSPNFGFAWARVAELEFSAGKVDAAKEALSHALQLSPRNAQALTLQGFIFAAQNRTTEAMASFDQAIAIDGALANAWLGRGLCKIHNWHYDEGRKDLMVAATLEPNRSDLRSYLGKAWAGKRWVDPASRVHAEKELRLAKQLDPADPTPWLYSALLNSDYNHDNEAVKDLEKSKELNDNRSVFRSKLLLDQDQAVRGANLANIYHDLGMFDVSQREAATAVDNDYGNYSAHLFLANSYDDLRDPKHINLRYETPWFSQLLVADLLAPVGAVSLSQNVSQQEYSRLFDGNNIGAYSDTQYTSRGQWQESASVYGNEGNSGFSVDTYYRSDDGYRPNNGLEDFNFTAKFKQQLTAQDSVFFEISTESTHSGDLSQYYSQTNASTALNISEYQDPNIYLGYHREWATGIHTLALFGRLVDHFTLNTPSGQPPGGLFFVDATATLTGPITAINTPVLSPETYTSDLEAYTAELQQIFETDHQTLVVGARYQAGTLNDSSFVQNSRVTSPFPGLIPTPFSSAVNLSLDRITGYGYYTVHPFQSFSATAGLSYDYLKYPENDEFPPLSGVEDERSQFSPKAGFRWTPLDHTTVRGAWTRSLGGVFFDTSVRLEPTELSGFNQAFRSILPESVSGLVPGSQFETFDLAVDQVFPTHTYVSVVAELLDSHGSRGVGVFTHSGPFFPSSRTINEDLDYQDRSLSLIVNQLVGDDFAFGASYKVDVAKLDDGIAAIPAGQSANFSPSANRTVKGVLHQVDVYALYNHPCGFFAKVDAIWSAQSNQNYAVDLPGDDFAQFNIYAGYRLPRRTAQFQVGLLNVGNRNYQLNPLNLYSELPRERTFVAELKLNF